MAPRKRKGATESETTATATTTFKRVTRSQTRGDVKNEVVQQVNKKNDDKNKKKKKTTPKSEVEQENEASQLPNADVDASSSKKTVIVEHCTQCTQFKKRAIMVKEGLMEAVPGVNVILNPVKPRRGCFEIREEGGESFVSLLDMKRPFEPMKKLVMDDVIANIIDKIKE